MKREHRPLTRADWQRLAAIECRLEALEKWHKKHERALQRALGYRSCG